MSAYRTPATPKPPEHVGCQHVWEARPVWHWEAWVILHYDRRCRSCGARPPFLRRAWFSILDELRRLGFYDRNHEKLGEGIERGRA